jgi:hypothetical protein
VIPRIFVENIPGTREKELARLSIIFVQIMLMDFKKKKKQNRRKCRY